MHPNEEKKYYLLHDQSCCKDNKHLICILNGCTSCKNQICKNFALPIITAIS